MAVSFYAKESLYDRMVSAALGYNSFGGVLWIFYGSF